MAVADLIADARNYAGSVTTDARTALLNAQNMVSQVGYAIPNFDPVTMPDPPPDSAGLIAPVLDFVTLDLPPEPSAVPGFQDISALEPGDAPVLVATPPTIMLPTAPSQVAEFTQTAPGIDTDIVFPEPPDELLHPMIEAPTVTDRTAPTKPDVALPVFGAIAPVDDTVAPTDLQGQFASAYQGAAPATIALLEGYLDAELTKINPRYHEQMGRIETQLATYLDGGTALKPAVETAIYERARGKGDAEARRVRAAARDAAADLGFTLPSGALNSAMNQARQAAADNNARAATEIAIAQAEMEQKNLQFAVTTSANLRVAVLSAMLSYHQNLVSINGQALEYAKSILSAIIETYNTAVKAFAVRLDAYRAEAVVYDTRLKSAMAGIELYKIEIQALEALTNVDRARVEVYRARIDGLNALANVYKAQIEAVQGRASLEKLKLDLFQSQVQAYAAQVQGKNAEWQGYTAAIEGQTAKIKIFSSQVDAYSAQVQGYKATIEGKAEVVRSAALTNKARADNFAAIMSGYQVVVQARGEKARTQLENQRQQILSFQSQAQAAVSNAQIRVEYFRAVSSIAIKNAELKMTAQIKTADSTRDYGAAIAHLGTASAGVYSGLAQSAMSGMVSMAGELKNE